MVATLTALVCLALPAMASAAPRFDIELTRNPLSMPKTDTIVEYSATIRNLGTATVGEELTCAANAWTPASGVNAPTFGFQWLSNGEPASGSVTSPTASTSTYTVHADDEGSSVQCQVVGTNPIAAATIISAPTFVGTAPETRPPTINDSRVANSRPTITGTGAFTTKRTCNPPAGWSGSPTWSYQWLRNAVPIPGATSNEYQPVNADDTGKILQCRILGQNDSGAIVGISSNNPVGTVSNPPTNTAGNTPLLTSSATTDASLAPALQFQLELPPGEETYVANSPLVSPPFWSCAKQFAAGEQPATLTCTYTSATVRGWGEILRDPISGLVIQLDPDTPDPTLFTATASGGGAPDPTVLVAPFDFDPPVPFGITPGTFEALARDAGGDPYEQAGGHPFSAGAIFGFNTRRVFHQHSALGSVFAIAPVEPVREIATDLPPGFLGNPGAVPQRCISVEEMRNNTPSNPSPECPPGSIVGTAAIFIREEGSNVDPRVPAFPDTPFAGGGFPVYAIEPERGVPAQFAFVAPLVRTQYSLSARLRAGDGYAVSVDAPRSPSAPELTGARVTLCGFGAEVINDGNEFRAVGCKESTDPGALEKPFLANTTKCAGGQPVTDLHADSWVNRATRDSNGVPELSNPNWKSDTAVAPPVTGCENVPFEPEVDLDPTSNRADSPTGLEVELTVPSEGFESPEGISQAHLKKTTVTLPEGMGVNPGALDGLGACTSEQIGLGTNDPVECPESSKVGTAEVVTPLLEEKLEGEVYIAKQVDNPFGTLVALYIVVESEERGVLIKIPGRVDLDPATGRIVSTFDDNPQAPFSSLKLRFRGGERAPLVNPPTCGSYDIVSEMTPWSAADPDNPTESETVTQTSTFEVAAGPGGGPCPTDSFEPKLNAGTENPVAGDKSPFLLRLHREDGTQRFRTLGATMPPGLTAYLRGVPYCPDAVLASIPTAEGTGAAEIANPSCPAASRIGSVSVGAGAGNPYYVNTGSAYLAGPYKGAPLSIAVVVPAVAGPFDLGSELVRTALHVDPVSTRIEAISDPIPLILKGALLNVRDIRVFVDRSGFILNPTNCSAMAVGAKVGSEKGATADLSNRFQVGECAALGFKPRTQIQLFGGVTRAKYQGVRAVVRPRPGDANIAGATVRFPSSAFVAQEHLQNICTRVQWAADACPKNSIYGKAIAYSPLLDEPLRGNLHLRSSNNLLPDLVADLRGPAHQPIRVEVAVRNDSVKGALRNTVQTAPDAPVSYFRMQVFGGKKALIVNSRNICQGTNNAQVSYRAHNGRRSSQAIPVRNAKCGKWRKAQKRKAAQKRKRMIAKKRAAARQG